MSNMPIYGVVFLTALWFFLGFVLGVLIGRAVEWVEIGRLQRENRALRISLDKVERSAAALKVDWSRT